MDIFENFCDLINVHSLPKLDAAIAFIWFNNKVMPDVEIDVKKINDYFIKASLPKYNTTYLREGLKKTRSVTKGSKNDTYKLARTAQMEFDKEYQVLFEVEEISISESVNLKLTPYLNSTDIEAARKMAELYVIIHCYENSARRLIEDILAKKFGVNWWDKAASAGMVTKFNERKSKEAKNKWLSSRGSSSPLYYLDWADLVTLIRKYAHDFTHKIHDLKFVELRLEELEKTRNIVAHNGILPSDDDFQRVLLSFKDWCKQLS